MCGLLELLASVVPDVAGALVTEAVVHAFLCTHFCEATLTTMMTAMMMLKMTLESKPSGSSLRPGLVRCCLAGSS